MSVNVAQMAQNIFSTMSKGEVEDLIRVLHYFNSQCKEANRAACVGGGCTPKDSQTDHEIEEGCKDAILGVKKFSATKTAGEIYLSTPRPVCPCCRQ
jgi:hypothetical protein